MGKISYKITEARELPSPYPDRLGKTDFLVTWIEDSARVYSLFIPSESFSREETIRRVEAEVAKRAQIVGHEAEVSG